MAAHPDRLAQRADIPPRIRGRDRELVRLGRHQAGAHEELLDLPVDPAVAIEAIAVDATVPTAGAAPLARHPRPPDLSDPEVAPGAGRIDPHVPRPRR